VAESVALLQQQGLHLCPYRHDRHILRTTAVRHCALQVHISRSYLIVWHIFMLLAYSSHVLTTEHLDC
jgi:hypothetical protein